VTQVAGHSASVAGAEARARLYERPPRSLSVAAAALLGGVCLFLGWRVRDEYLLVADSGLGYALGIVGLAMMTLLLLYSLRKRSRSLRGAGPLRIWFQTHMVLGLLGPCAILLHANFRLGSLNSTAALLSMLLVAGSGIVGRFLYTRVHYELFGHVASLSDLRRATAAGRNQLGSALTAVPALGPIVERFESFALAPPRGLLLEGWRVMTIGARYRRAARAARRAIARAAGSRAAATHARRAVQDQLGRARRVGEFTFYERLFSLWHALHLPLCVVLFGAAVVHVVAVHMY
jgi:hypothetical protein